MEHSEYRWDRGWQTVLSVLRRLRPVLIGYAVLGTVLWPFPVLNILHVESSAVVAFIAFFAAGLSSLRLMDQGYPVRIILPAQEGALVIPWAMLTLSALWAPNCGYLQGMLFYALFPVVSVVLSVSLAYALAATEIRRKKLVFVLIGGAVSVFGLVYDVGFHPQFYSYNHVFGGILGPIYDEELAVRPGLFAFRALTLLWSLLLFQLGARIRAGQFRSPREAAHEENTGPQAVPVWASRPAVAGVAITIGGCYLFAASLGLNTPAWYIQQELGGHYRTEHFDIYYDPAEIDEQELHFVALDHEYHYHRLAERLDVRVNARIRSYLYPDADVKAQLTGARYTNVAPTWLDEPQTHVLASRYADVFPHELAHVFSREFGLPVLRATLSVGLVEGLAVALEPPDGLPSPDEQVLAALLLAGREHMPDLVANVASRLSPLGFWTGRGAVSYTTTGSFVQYLLDAYGAGPLKQVYAFGNFEEVYGKSLLHLAEEWQRSLYDLPHVARNSAGVVLQRFTIPSLFEVECPHYVPGYLRAYRAGVEAMEEGDSTLALRRFSAALEEAPTFMPALTQWAQLRLAQEQVTEVIARLDTLPPDVLGPAANVTLGDAYALAGDSLSARQRYDQAAVQLVADTQGARSILLLRSLMAGRPEVIRVLTSGWPEAQKAARLSRLEGKETVLHLLQGLEWALADEYSRAVRLLAATEMGGLPQLSPAGRRLLDRQRLEWLARFSYRSGALDAAHRYAVEAARAYQAAGDFTEADLVEAFADKVLWAQQQTAMGNRPSWASIHAR